MVAAPPGPMNTNTTSQVKITIKIDNSRQKAVKKCLFTSYIKINNHKQQPLDNRAYTHQPYTTVWSEAPRKLTIYYYCKCHEVNQTIHLNCFVFFPFSHNGYVCCLCFYSGWSFSIFRRIQTWNFFFFFRCDLTSCFSKRIFPLKFYW